MTDFEYLKLMNENIDRRFTEVIGLLNSERDCNEKKFDKIDEKISVLTSYKDQNNGGKSVILSVFSLIGFAIMAVIQFFRN